MALLVGGPAPSAIVVARAPDVAIDCAAILKQLTATFGGKGGGRPELAQGGGLQGRPKTWFVPAAHLWGCRRSDRNQIREIRAVTEIRAIRVPWRSADPA